MTGKEANIVHDDRLTLGSGSPAYALAESNLQTARAALIGAHPHQLSWLDYPIEARPEKAQGSMKQGRDRRHTADRIVDALEHQIDLVDELSVRHGAWELAQICNRLSHGVSQGITSVAWRGRTKFNVEVVSKRVPPCFCSGQYVPTSSGVFASRLRVDSSISLRDWICGRSSSHKTIP